ncbi:GBF-interacting protein 1-like isoform X2 [Phoenix dactylifera]|uniref:GBF-interacting protein 1-like isoform X2 n=1 Tax=Phoenix dactylifera TaxID=42345 RepID=A0A8B9AHQ8_PHODC|nr:GBF-interacting protein 1-like isoform X2 [Phoenix dactylifera]
MVLGSRLDGESQVVSVRIRKTIQSIKEIVGNHSDADIYAMLRETNMDPNETAQKLLNQDPFHEVKRKRDKNKEHTGYRGSGDTNKRVEHNVQWAKFHTSWDRNARRGGFIRKPAPGISQEFRIVRDNRVNQSASRDVKSESIQHSASGNEQVVSDVPEKSSAWVPTHRKKMAAKNSEGHMLTKSGNEPCHSEAYHAKDSDRPLLPQETQPMISISEAQKEVHNNSKSQSKLTSTNSVIGLYWSSSDPVHVPSDSRSAGTVGAIQREVGAVGVRKQSSNYPTVHSSVSSSSISVPLLEKDTSSPAKSSIQSAAMSRSNQLIQTPSSEPVLSSTSFGRSFSASQHHSRLYQPPVGHQKAVQSNMEWKPKSSQKTTAVRPSVIETSSSSPHADGSGSPNPVDVPGLSEKLSQVNILETQHVIMPLHLQVPESEHIRLTFGSFGAGFDAANGYTSTLQAFENAQEINEPTLNILATGPAGSSEDASAANEGDVVDGQARTSQPDSIASSTEYEEAQPGNSESLSPQDIGSFEDIGLVQRDSPPYSSVETQQLRNQSDLPSFSAYYPQMSYDAPFFRTAMEDNVRPQGLSSPSEVWNSHAASSSPSSSITMVQPQQQPIGQLYPQVHISHYPNFVPYRHILSPVYVPPMAVPNYSSNTAYPHPSNGNNYVLMPGANSHITAGSMKYAPSQYKPVPTGSPTGYGNYANPAGFTISSPGTLGSATGLEDMTRIKYKENSLYIPTPQADTSDIWIQTQRELSSLQSAPYYSLSGQAPPAAFMPTHAGHASFNAAAQSSHVQYPGLYHPPQLASVTSPHPLAAPALGGSVGVGVAAPGPQVGAYQQPQLSHLNWTANF